MFKKFHIVTILLFLGFFLSPTFSYSCGIKTEKSSCKKAISTSTKAKDCCNGKHLKDKKNNCGGKCGHSNCTTSTVNFSLLSSNDYNFNSNFNFYSKKVKFITTKTFISSGFTSLWSPPNIK